MTSEIVRQGRAAWGRLKKGNGDWADWILVGAALLEGRKIAMHNARTDRASGTGYVQALQSWQLANRLDLRPLERNDLFKVMAILPDIEAWRATLPPARRARIGRPAAVLHNYRKATGPALERVTPPSQADLR
jgi:hypothetical protein